MACGCCLQHWDGPASWLLLPTVPGSLVGHIVEFQIYKKLLVFVSFLWLRKVGLKCLHLERQHNLSKTYLKNQVLGFKKYLRQMSMYPLYIFFHLETISLTTTEKARWLGMVACTLSILAFTGRCQVYIYEGSQGYKKWDPAFKKKKKK